MVRKQGFLSPSSDYQSKRLSAPQASADSPERTLQPHPEGFLQRLISELYDHFKIRMVGVRQRHECNPPVTLLVVIPIKKHWQNGIPSLSDPNRSRISGQYLNVLNRDPDRHSGIHASSWHLPPDREPAELPRQVCPPPRSSFSFAAV